MSEMVRIGSVMVYRDMLLPEGKTCGDCHHLKRCKALFGCPPGNTQCDWSPSRYRAAKSEPTP